MRCSSVFFWSVMSSSSTPQADPAATDRAAAPPAAEVPGDAAGRGWAATGRAVQANATTNAQSDGARDLTAMSSPCHGARFVSEHSATVYHARRRLTAGTAAGPSPHAVHAVVDEIVDDGRVGQGRDVAQLAVLVGGDLAQDAAHDLAGAGLRQVRGPLQQIGRGDRADLLAHPLHQLAAQLFVRLLVDPQRHIGVDALALDVVRIADDGRLGDLRVGDQRALDLGGAEAVAGDVDHIVDPAGDPIEAVGVAARSVTGEIKPLEGREIGFDEALMVAIDGSHHAGPGARQAEIAFANPVEPLAVAVDDDRLDPEERPRRRARLQRRRAGDRGNQDAAGLGLPPGVDDRAAFLADIIVVPQPGFGIDRLADRAEQPQ